MFETIKSIQKRDPAKPTFLEVFFAYNGFHAIVWHKLSNVLWRLNLKALARFTANLGRIFTAIEIHPEAKIGRRLFIDHGTGVVIGQTAVIGNDVTIYHGVTLGGVGRASDKSDKRHPTLDDGAMIGSGAQILGNIIIGKNARIGSNSVVTNDVPDECTAIGIPARVICKGKDGTNDRAYGLPSRKELEGLSSTIDGLMVDMERIKKAVNLDDAKHDSDIASTADAWSRGDEKTSEKS
ncbi:MAG: serine O-acetyltransferase [Bdellovibrionales bacterium]